MAAESRNLRQSWPDTDCADTVGNCGNGYKMTLRWSDLKDKITWVTHSKYGCINKSAWSNFKASFTSGS